MQVVAAEHRDPAICRRIEIEVETRAGGERRHLSRREIDARDMRHAAFLDERNDRPPSGVKTGFV